MGRESTAPRLSIFARGSGHEAPTCNVNYRSCISISSAVTGSDSSLGTGIPLIAAHDVVTTCALLHTVLAGDKTCTELSGSLKNVSFTKKTVKTKKNTIAVQLTNAG